MDPMAAFLLFFMALHLVIPVAAVMVLGMIYLYERRQKQNREIQALYEMGDIYREAHEALSR